MQSYSFKEFILNEAQAYLGQKVGDILTATQELRDDSPNMGSRDLTRFSERIVNQIRRVLHSNWPKEEKKHLVTLQKVGVALMKSIEEKDDLPGIIASSASSLEKLVADLGIPIHKLASTDATPEEDDNNTEGPQDQSASPPQPSVIDKAGPVGPPNSGDNVYTPPLAGSSGPMDSF